MNTDVLLGTLLTASIIAGMAFPPAWPILLGINLAIPAALMLIRRSKRSERQRR